jgi:hypothetical protein
MPVTVSYDLRTDNANHRNYIRSMFERLGWKRLGGSVFRYENRRGEEDWLNDVVPALMFFRSYTIAHAIEVRFFTLDTQSVAHIDFSDSRKRLGKQPIEGTGLNLRTPTNLQSSARAIRDFVQAAIDEIAG